MARKKLKISVKGFCWKKWGKKLAKNSAIVVLAGLASVYGGNSWFLALAPGLLALENFVKHW